MGLPHLFEPAIGAVTMALVSSDCGATRLRCIQNCPNHLGPALHTILRHNGSSHLGLCFNPLCMIMAQITSDCGARPGLPDGRLARRARRDRAGQSLHPRRDRRPVRATKEMMQARIIYPHVISLGVLFFWETGSLPPLGRVPFFGGRTHLRPPRRSITIHA